MTVESGLEHELYVDGNDLSDDIGSASRIGGGPAALDVTGIRHSAHRRVGGIRDGSIAAQAWFNKDTGGPHPVLSTLPRIDRVVSYLTGTALGRPAACLVGKQPNYDPTRGADAQLTIAFETLGSRAGLEWGEVLAARAAHAGPTAGAGLDFGAGVGTTAFGLQAYLHLHALTGTDITVAVQHSDDDGAVDPYTDITGAVFTTAAAAPAAQRVQTARTESIKRWIRINSTGTFTAATVSVIAVKNELAVAF